MLVIVRVFRDALPVTAAANNTSLMTMADLGRLFAANGVMLSASNKSVLYGKFAGPNLQAAMPTPAATATASNPHAALLSRSLLRSHVKPAEDASAASRRNSNGNSTDERVLTINFHELCNSIYICDWV